MATIRRECTLYELQQGIQSRIFRGAGDLTNSWPVTNVIAVCQDESGDTIEIVYPPLPPVRWPVPEEAKPTTKPKRKKARRQKPKPPTMPGKAMLGMVMSARLAHALMNENVTTLAGFCRVDLKRTPNVGRTTRRELKILQRRAKSRMENDNV